MKELLERLMNGERLSAGEAGDLLSALTDPATPAARIGAALSAMRVRGETADEVAGLARAMRRCAVAFETASGTAHAVDLVGTGGDGAGSYNLSTGAALLAAACGLTVIKHGNRSISSRCGSADVLEELGAPVDVPPSAAQACLRRAGFVFLFAPRYHPALASLARVRRELGVRTVFNIMGPLSNPARPPFGVIGAFSLDAARLMAGAFARLEHERVFVVHGARGWDEPTPMGPFHLLDVRAGSVSESVIDPLDAGLHRCDVRDLHGGDAAHNARAIRAVFSGEQGPHRDALLLGAALALWVTGECEGLREGVIRAASTIDDGRAAALLQALPDPAPSSFQAPGQDGPP